MLGFKNFYSSKATLSGIEFMRIIQKEQLIGTEKAEIFGTPLPNLGLNMPKSLDPRPF